MEPDLTLPKERISKTITAPPIRLCVRTKSGECYEDRAFISEYPAHRPKVRAVSPDLTVQIHLHPMFFCSN